MLAPEPLPPETDTLTAPVYPEPRVDTQTEVITPFVVMCERAPDVPVPETESVSDPL